MLGLALVWAEVGIPGSPIRRDRRFLVNNIPTIVMIITEVIYGFLTYTYIACQSAEHEEDASEEVGHKNIDSFRIGYFCCR